ncbi:MAG: gfo/Idh/MocA family oxidoreductase [Spirochaetaceae bacterium]|nr:MAG: gfo/Idh/MocA family oxidoreductase [Spirochaetaceae bacterium]
MNKYRVGIVGLGWVGGAHLDTFVKSERFEPTAIMSTRNLDPAWIREQHGAEVTVYTDYEQFLQDDSIDVVDICTPHSLHPEQTIAASDAGKHLIIEKPLALNFPDTRRMLETVTKNDTRTSVCFEVRFASSVIATKALMDKGLIGDLYYAEADYYHGIGPWYANQRWEVKKVNGGSSLLRAGCHALDALLYLAEAQVEEVFTYGNKNPNKIFEPYDYPLNTVTLLKFRQSSIIGKVASVTDCRQPYVFNINMVGSDGTIRNNQFCSKLIDGLKGWSTLDVTLVDSGDVSDHPYLNQFDHFAECLDLGVDPHNNLENAYQTHRVIFAADKSAETGKPVRIDEFV